MPARSYKHRYMIAEPSSSTLISNSDNNRYLFAILLSIVFLLAILIYLAYGQIENKHHATTTTTIIQPNEVNPVTDMFKPPEKKNPWFEQMRQQYSYWFSSPPTTNQTNYNQYPNSLPINIHTRRSPESYQQVGILTGNDLSGYPTVTPLMGRRTPYGNYKFQYYTMFNGNGNIATKLPVYCNNKPCSGEYGCDELSDGDIVSAEGYGNNFKVTIYKDELPRYIPL